MLRSPFSAALALLALAAGGAPSGHAQERALAAAPQPESPESPGSTGSIGGLDVVTRARADGRAGSGYLRPSKTPCLSPDQRAGIQAAVARSQRRLRLAGLLSATARPDLRFRWPLRAVGHDPRRFGVHGISNYVDHDPTGPNNLLDFDCGERTYDLSNGYDHRGTDLFTWPLPWTWMDSDRVEVVAVAPGTIVLRSDGNFDQSCGFGGSDWNAVYVQHDDGTMVWYGHMKNGSLTPKSAGQRVAAGEFLGIVGSSGNSTGPHLHLEVYDALGHLVDPFAGPCNGLNQRSRWRDQRPYHDSAVNQLMVGDAPIEYPSCPAREVTHEVTVVPRGITTYFTTFYRDQLAFQLSTYRIVRPSGSVFHTWNHSSATPHYAASYWWWSFLIGPGEESGVWTFEVDYEGRTYVAEFLVT